MDNDDTSGARAVAPPQGQARLARRILVADDESGIRRLIASVLTGSGYDVDAAEDGAAAWEALQTKPYDLLITDHNMPKITGVELVKNLRSARMSLPVVLVVGVLPADELAQNPSLQFAATLLKPFALPALLKAVEDALRSAHSSLQQFAPSPG